MATLGGESQPFPSAALAAAAGVGGGGGALGLQAPLNRGLERALEEAAHSGGLNLSGRKLKEFPRSAAAPSHDLSDTVRAGGDIAGAAGINMCVEDLRNVQAHVRRHVEHDVNICTHFSELVAGTFEISVVESECLEGPVKDLSKNRLTEVPTELCHFVSLETLNLYHNCIKVIPDAIVNLQMLTYLNLSRNQLSSLPACLCGLPLKVLIASNNKLGSLPEEIGQLKQLMELDVSCNEITALPQQIGQLKSLKELNVRRNYLEVLPQELVQLPLVKFDFSCNKVLVIPICFRKMVQLQVLLLENNPLQSPPAQICTKGKVHIFKYLTVQACQIKTADSLYLNAIEPQHLPQPVEESIDDIYPSKKDSDSGVGSDNGDKRLSATEPSDEDTISFNVPMSDIVEEDHIIKDDLGHHANSRKGKHNGLYSCKSRAAECDELLRIEEDTQWQADEIINLSEEQTIDIEMIEQLREAVDLLQDCNSGQMQMDMSSLGQRENAEEELEFQRRRDLIMEKAKPEARTCEQGEKWSLNQNDLIVWNRSGQSSHNESKDKSPTMSPTTNTTIPFGLKPRSVFLRPQRNLESIDPQFTIRRKMEQMREERELVEQLREPKLSMAKCRRNVENFLDACRKLGIPEEKLCLPHHILEEKGLVKVSITVQALLDVTTVKQALFT
ncbi:hypothetical protein DUI87_16587 [Hirundo rustica rustica]|uniref:Leucine-rich repeat and calponin homology domain-containing protein 1 n=1 Tax=Hirundo rustica rustica TaxID=333673 RepID=A0A3M0K3Y4_HIRRU|nr:hypothetical protein DUI87_16587 [Hirundo rustica rustica]